MRIKNRIDGDCDITSLFDLGFQDTCQLRRGLFTISQNRDKIERHSRSNVPQRVVTNLLDHSNTSLATLPNML